MQKIIVLPGWSGSNESWKSFVEFASTDFDISVIDLPCFGTEPCPNTVWGVEEYAEFVYKKLSAIDTTDTILLGHSFGGQVATHLVAHHKDICKKLVLSGAAVIRRPQSSARKTFFQVLSVAGKFIFSMPILWRAEKVAKKVLYKGAGSQDYNKTSGIQREIFKKVITQDMSHELPKIEMDTLVIWGTDDRHTPLEHGKEIANKLRHSKFVSIKGARHGLHINNKAELLEALKDFSS